MLSRRVVLWTTAGIIGACVPQRPAEPEPEGAAVQVSFSTPRTVILAVDGEDTVVERDVVELVGRLNRTSADTIEVRVTSLRSTGQASRGTRAHAVAVMVKEPSMTIETIASHPGMVDRTFGVVVLVGLLIVLVRASMLGGSGS